MRPFKAQTGNDHLVSEAHAAAIDAGLGTTAWPDAGAAERRRVQLLETSNGRPLTPEERAELGALTHIKNLHSAAAFLDLHGFEPSIVGASAALDSVHGGIFTAACGCSVAVAFDHHRRADPANQVHAVGTLAKCADHARHQHHKDLFAALSGGG